MPATEQTWRNLKALHVVFAITSILLLISTIAMLAIDHNRPWKKYQREFRNLETWSARAAVDEQDSRSYEATTKLLEEKLTEARTAPLDSAIAAQFVIQAKTDPVDAVAVDRVQQDIDVLASQQSASERLVLRGDLLQRCRDIAKRARYREELAAGQLKLRKAEFDKARADYELGVSDDAAESELAPLLLIADSKRAEVADAGLINQGANSHRKNLEGLVRQMVAAEESAAKLLADHRQKLSLLAKTVKDRAPNVGKSLLELPVLDAFNSPLRPDQLWLPQLTLNNNFRDVARFDRCTTCHKGIDKSAPGSPDEQAYQEQEILAISLPTPSSKPIGESAGNENNRLEDAYGFQFSPRGLFHSEDSMVSVILPGSVAAEAGLAVGDVIAEIEGGRILSQSMAFQSLLETLTWGKPLMLSVRRGVPQPYTSHPRLDLYVGGSSPHPMQSFGCTICHQGQGSSTSFEWASHSSNTPKQGLAWHKEYGWFNNHHWILPMLPQRFDQSSCLKCHHQVVDLEPTERFPEPPAPKLVEGYHLVRQYGCYGCHEINGWANPDKRIGPDMRLAPNYHEVAQSISIDPGLASASGPVTRWIDEVSAATDGKQARERLRAYIDRDAASDNATLSPRTHQLASLLKEPETPGTFPKVGPSLRHVSSKVGFDWLYAWLRNPTDFRPSTKMPRFFGLWEHLSGKGLEESKLYEPIEIRSMITYLLNASQPFEYVLPFEGITAKPDIERGKKVVQVRGCLACHQHADFPDAKNNHGPHLSRIGAKFSGTKQGSDWLYSWLREPNRYHPRTLMPNVLLTPVKLPDGSISDPALDATVYLMGSTENWKPSDIPAADSLVEQERQSLNELALLYLKDRFPLVQAKEYLEHGIPADVGALMQGDERLLTGMMDANRDGILLDYVGRKTIAKLACAGCHDIPGYEDSKPAGAALADWGRKESSKIAFEQVSNFVLGQMNSASHHAHASHETSTKHDVHGTLHDADADAHASDAGHADALPHSSDVNKESDENSDTPVAADLAYAAGSHASHTTPHSVDPDTGYFLEKLLGHEREGFLWQKLRAPRSYDYKKTENKSYNERYRMPKFPFDDKQREAVMTFVLGLVSEPPAPQFINQPSIQEQARLHGLVVAEQYNCGGCHSLEMDRWDIRHKPGSLGEAPTISDYPFLSPHFNEQEIAQSLITDRKGRRQSTLRGAPVLDEKTGTPQMVDEDGVPLTADDTESVPHHLFMLYRDALIDGEARRVGAQNLLVPKDALLAGTEYRGRGGDFARLLFPVVIADEKQINPNVKADDAWGWLPPPLIGEGKKVQSSWLHRFLLNPEIIRPATVLRMPKFNLSSSDSSSLVAYFASVDGADYPYEYDPRFEDSRLVEAEKSHPGHLEGALRIVTNNNYCVKCHLLGNYAPPGNVKALAPQLERVHQRLRPDYVHGWIANPRRFLPYTGMPVNIPFDKPVSQDLYSGSSDQQLDALTDLLMHFDGFAKKNLSLDAYFKQQPIAPEPPPSSAANVQPALGLSALEKKRVDLQELITTPPSPSSPTSEKLP